MIIYAALRKTLSVRCPNTDFTPYFAFIESLPPLQNGGHKHHILPKKEFPEFSKTPSNLIRLTTENHLKAHYWLALCAPTCIPFQQAFFLMVGMKHATQISEDELPRYAEIYRRGQVAQIEISRVFGRKNAENGHLARIRELARRTPETQNQKLSRRLSGRKAVESGHIQRLGRLQGPKNIENGRVQGRKNVESGQLANLRTHEHQVAAGRAAGKKAVDTGQLAAICHTRWHINRQVVIPNCALCQGGGADAV